MTKILLPICAGALLFGGNVFAVEAAIPTIGYAADRAESSNTELISCTSYTEVATRDELMAALNSTAEADKCIKVTANISFSGLKTLGSKTKKIVGSDSSITLTGTSSGMLRFTGACTIDIENITLTKGSKDYGGAIFADGGSSNVRLGPGSRFVNNSAGVGGAVDFASSGKLIIDGAYFKGNSSSFKANAVLVGSGTLYVNNSTFVSNSGGYEGGGAIQVNGPSAVIENSHFISNTSVPGGAAVRAFTGTNAGYTLRINNCMFDSNTTSNNMGGAVYAYNYITHVENSTFDSNSAKSNGGAIAAIGASTEKTSILYLNNNVFYSNSSKAQGGAVYATISEVYSEGNVFQQNSATGNGGAFSLLNSCSHLERDTIFENTTQKSGGGIYNRPDGNADTFGMLNMTNCTLYYNKATKSGGGIYIDLYYAKNAAKHADAQDSRFIHNTFAYNQSGTGGGGILAFGAAPGSGYYWYANLVGGNSTNGSIDDCTTKQNALLYSIDSGFSVMGSATGCSWTTGQGDKSGYSASEIVPTAYSAGKYSGGLFESRDTEYEFVYVRPEGVARDIATSSPLTYDVRKQTRPYGSGADAGSYEVVYRDVTVNWDDDSDSAGIRPASLSGLYLFAADEDGKYPTPYMTEPDVMSDSGDVWKYRFDDVWAFNPDITYVPEYPTPDGYMVSDFTETSTGWEITYSPQTKSLTVRKIWADASNNDGHRPASVCIVLYNNGAATSYSHELSGSGDTWEYTFTDIPDSSDYTIVETGIHCQ